MKSSKNSSQVSGIWTKKRISSYISSDNTNKHDEDNIAIILMGILYIPRVYV